jgi:Domain of unknown function (DUF4158)
VSNAIKYHWRDNHHKKESEMKRTWTSEELLEYFTLLPDELAAVSNKSGATRLGFAVLLKCSQYEGRFPRSRQEVASEVVRFLATQVGVDAPLFAHYAWERRTIEAHRAQIREMSKMRVILPLGFADSAKYCFLFPTARLCFPFLLDI